MFEVPEAKRVRREDLGGSDGSDWSEAEDDSGAAELQARLNAQIARSLGLDTAPSDSHQLTAKTSQPNERKEELVPSEVDEDGAEDAEDEGYEFRLFSTSTDAPKIVLEDDQVLKGDGTFVAPRRPLSYYLITDVPENKRKQYEFAAVSADDVLAQSQLRAKGLELSWKVTEITATGRKVNSTGDAGKELEEETTKRKRPGKKRRIALRTKDRAKTAQKEAAAKQKQEKEEHIKDKKKRMNRLKKLRKRAKDKEKKLATKGEDGDAGEGSESGDDSEGSD